ncbi:MAG: NAD-dependent epimerase/dehydratase family protein [Candidatus Izemoplasmatales bacterium]|nr:NAD-dependent epimerase/dehydratase family protein [Candidatus Izemoplasmatales bacterium]MDD4069845.1 NAD-dependent epimerase/dehydratase family protein [Candidatus Izemoplasmatales bacterium]
MEMIYITGASGHIGNNLVKQLNDNNIDFRILARRMQKSIIEFKEKTIIGDVFSYDFLNKHIEKNDVLIHLAAYINLDNLQEKMTKEINYDGLITIANFCVEKNVYLVYTSSTDVFNGDKYLVNEQTKIILEDLSGYYQKYKAKATLYLTELINQNKIKAAILYPSAVIGINDYKPSQVGKHIKKTLKKRILPYFNGGYNFVDVQDVCKSIISAINLQFVGSCIISNKYLTLKEIYKLISASLNKKIILIKIPLFVIKCTTHVFPKLKVMINALLTPHNFDNKIMIEDLKVIPTPIETTINNTLNWFK